MESNKLKSVHFHVVQCLEHLYVHTWTKRLRKGLEETPEAREGELRKAGNVKLRLNSVKIN